MIEIPEDGWYKITAKGARGGGKNGGKGASVSTMFKLSTSDKVHVAVGQQGKSAENNRDDAEDDDADNYDLSPKHWQKGWKWDNIGSGGGGGTFIWKNDDQVPMLVAGGGGGTGSGPDEALLDGTLSNAVGAPHGAPGNPRTANAALTSDGASGASNDVSGEGGKDRQRLDEHVERKIICCEISHRRLRRWWGYGRQRRWWRRWIQWWWWRQICSAF